MPRLVRDSQRSKVYKSGWGFQSNHPFGDIKEIRRSVIKIFRSRWMKGLYKKFGVNPGLTISVRDGRGRRTACMERDYPYLHRGIRSYSLKFPRGSRSHYTVLHEIAHILAL